MTGYLPYTTIAITVAFLIISGSRSWGAVLTGGVIFIAWSVGICICQLAILFVPYPDKSGFHSTSVLITLASMLLAPLVIGVLIWLISAVSKLAS